MNDHLRMIKEKYVLLFIFTSFWPPWLYALGVFSWFMFDKLCYRVTLPTGGQNEEDKSNS
tara:strand:+ start:535 stop:714 length:180 start_codon:yes stop_codon:yes gene_type:complete